MPPTKFGHHKSSCSHPLSNTQHTTTPPPTHQHHHTHPPPPPNNSSSDRTGMRSMPQAGSSTTQKTPPHTHGVSPQDPTACRTHQRLQTTTTTRRPTRRP